MSEKKHEGLISKMGVQHQQNQVNQQNRRRSRQRHLLLEAQKSMLTLGPENAQLQEELRQLNAELEQLEVRAKAASNAGWNRFVLGQIELRTIKHLHEAWERDCPDSEVRKEIKANQQARYEKNFQVAETDPDTRQKYSTYMENMTQRVLATIPKKPANTKPRP